MNPSIESYFERLYQHDDPYGYRHRWYEMRKRQLLLACLPRPRFATCWEFGCSNGELSAALAARCDTLLATDGNVRAAALANQRLADFPHAHAQHALHPRDWPQGRFELIVFSEVGYFLPLDDLRECVRRMRTSLTDRRAAGGVPLAARFRRCAHGHACRASDAGRRAGAGKALWLRRRGPAAGRLG